MLIGKTVVLGITGGIACWQTPEIIGRLRDLMLNVYCIMTKSATEFITPLTLQVSSQNPVAVDMFERRKEWNIAHIALADIADLFLIAPATANTISKIANGIADDMLSTTVLATRAPVVIAPAMNPNMYSNQITQSNIKKLKERGFHFIDPEYGKTACGTEGVGRLARISVIINKVMNLLETQDKKEKKE
ncbi:bifunctional phosphopantothenoylcysteine decarboxylase/phosphopantothenate--cysteine ligase CoaBC [bacterium]|nr:bifunctional phosphopantothenoylcysteine decarboxylase/phosphopantothenate--cysteine ligase CoaBC [bacterium]